MTTKKRSLHGMPDRRTSFGFDTIMRNPDYSRFTTWYARSNRLLPIRRKTGGEVKH